MTNFSRESWQLLLTILGGALPEEHHQVIEYLRTESQVLKEKQGKKRILLNEDQRRRLAVRVVQI